MYSFGSSYYLHFHSVTLLSHISLKVKLGESGWRERYYDEKFSAKTPEEMEAVRKEVVSYLIFGNFFLVNVKF